MPGTRPFPLALALVVALVLIGGPYAGEARACSCALSPSNEEAFRRSDAVFSGEAIKIGELSPPAGPVTTGTETFLAPVTFEVREAWKGVSGESAVVYGQGPSASCGLDFERGETYLIFAGRSDENGALHTDYCGNTFAASEETARNILGPPETGGVSREPARAGIAPAYVAATVVLALGAAAFVASRRVRR